MGHDQRARIQFLKGERHRAFCRFGNQAPVPNRAPRERNPARGRTQARDSVFCSYAARSSRSLFCFLSAPAPRSRPRHGKFLIAPAFPRDRREASSRHGAHLISRGVLIDVLCVRVPPLAQKQPLCFQRFHIPYLAFRYSITYFFWKGKETDHISRFASIFPSSESTKRIKMRLRGQMMPT